MNWEKWKGHEYDSLKISIIILIIVVCGIFIASKTFLRDNRLTGMINPANTAAISITLSTIPGATSVEEGLYGIHMAKFLDEVAVADNWLEDITDITAELEPTYARFFAGGEVSYYHFKTTHLDPSRFTPDEIAALVNGNELRGNGFIYADREDEEANGNTGELAELTAVKPRYNNLSYVDGFQNVQPRNVIRDYADILQDVDASSMFVLNLRYSTPLAELEKIDFLIDEGITVLGIECGNEAYAKSHPWYNPGDPTVQAPLSVEEYLDTCDTYRETIQAVYPDIPFAVAAAPKKNFEEGAAWEASDFNEQWNIALATKMNEHGYDNYVLHFYAPFNSCSDEIASGDRDAIFECGKEEMRDLRMDIAGPNGTVRFPVILEWYRETFAGKNMWFTEWNINQDPINGTDARYANSVLHAAFVTSIMNMINTENAYHGNYITYANLHTYATDGGNAMVNLHISKGAGNSEPTDIGDFVRRTPYFAYMSMKDIYKENYVPLAASITSDDETLLVDDITLYAYKNGDTIALSFSNLTDTALDIQSITLDGATLDLSSSTSLYGIDGEANYSSRGATEFAVNPGYEVTIRDESSPLEETYIPAHGIATITFEATPTDGGDTDCTILEILTDTCEEEVVADIIKPEVALVSPTEGMVLTGTTTTLAAIAEDASGIEKVEFYFIEDGNELLIATDDVSPYKYKWNTSALEPGSYKVRARAFDTAGNTAASSAVKVKK